MVSTPKNLRLWTSRVVTFQLFTLQKFYLNPQLLSSWALCTGRVFVFPFLFFLSFPAVRFSHRLLGSGGADIFQLWQHFCISFLHFSLYFLPFSHFYFRIISLTSRCFYVFHPCGNKLALLDGCLLAYLFLLGRAIVVCRVRSGGGSQLTPVPQLRHQVQGFLFLSSQAAPPSPLSLLGLSQFTDHSLSLSFHLSPSRFFANLSLIRASLLHVETIVGPPFFSLLIFCLAPCSSPFWQVHIDYYIQTIFIAFFGYV